jgi:hypothetical protein
VNGQKSVLNDEKSKKAKTMIGKTNKMKNRTPLIRLALLFVVLLTLGTATARANILPLASIGFAPVGVTLSQTARINLVNTSEPGGIFVNWRFIDANGVVLAQSSVSLPLGMIVSVEYRRQGGLPRAEVRAKVDIFTSVSAESLRASLEVFNNDSGATTLVMGGSSQ